MKLSLRRQSAPPPPWQHVLFTTTLPISWTTFTLSWACRASHVNSRHKHSNRNYQHQKSRIMEYYRNKQINLDLIGGREENFDV
jgi:hypothetical protein